MSDGWVILEVLQLRWPIHVSTASLKRTSFATVGPVHDEALLRFMYDTTGQRL